MSTIAKKVGVIIGSTRAKRVGPGVAKFILDTASAAQPSIDFTLVDVADFKLPVFDEVAIPATVPTYGGKFEHAHTIAWSEAVAAFDGYIFVSPEYNFGPPGGVKNAIDYIYNEWKGKPIMIVTYGLYGGKSAYSSLFATFSGMFLNVVQAKTELAFPGDAEVKAMNQSVQEAGQGILSKETVAVWDREDKAGILIAVEELKEKLLAPPKAA